ncbi:ATP-dependent translocase ABCB1-like [Clavelina lepadiformis]|uniref:ATP-dependent translocase ABCB1-like n=1 Tax=Clavelina lepadiformis TaxID=159417 RepID=UPI00404342D6
METGNEQKFSGDDCVENKGAIVSRKEKDVVDNNQFSYFALYRYMTWQECILIVVGSLFALAHGVGFPMLFVLMGRMIDVFLKFENYFCQFDEGMTLCEELNATDLTTTQRTDVDARFVYGRFQEAGLSAVYNFLYVGLATMAVTIVQEMLLSFQATRQSDAISYEYFRGILRQDFSFHDLTLASELNTMLTKNLNLVKQGIGPKLGVTLQYLSTVVSCIVIALVFSYKIALVDFAASPLLILTFILFYKSENVYTKKELDSYTAAGVIAEETLSTISTVAAFGCQHKEISRYESNLNEARIVGIKKGILQACFLGIGRFVIYSMFGIAYWFGTSLALNGEIEVGDMVIAFSTSTYLSFAIGAVASSFSSCMSAKAAGAKIFQVIDRKSTIDVFADSGHTPENLVKSLQFRKVDFCYPSRKDVKVLKEVNLTVEANQKVALVGQSGSGKSTVVQLIERFYDPQSGVVEIGGHDIKSLNVHWLRSQIGFVSQEPVLFSTTIAENIRWGREGVTDEEIFEAAKKADAFEFISKFPKKFETLVGEKGKQMSGGQKQRIAIARAIVRNPNILLLDEATSALDAESEALVQAALEKATAGRTTIVIAHRLSTIRGADKIVAFNQGEVMEEGTHEELMEIENGIYRNLVESEAHEKIETFIDSESESSEDDLDEVTGKDNPALDLEVETVSSVVEKKKRSRKLRKKKKATKKNDDEVFPPISYKEILRTNQPEWCYITFGCLASLIVGATDVMSPFLLGEVLGVFLLKTTTDAQLEQAAFNGLMYFTLAVIAFVAIILKGSLLAKSGAKLTARLRASAFRALLRQDMAYFDDARHHIAALCERLTNDAARVQGATGFRLGLLCHAFGIIGVAFVIGFVYSWQLSLLMLVIVPLVIIASFLQAHLIIRSSGQAGNEHGSITSQVIHNVKTVASLSKEKEVLKLHKDALEATTRASNKQRIVSSLALGLSAIMPFLVFASTFRLGMHLVVTNNLHFNDVFRVLAAFTFASRALGITASLLPNYPEAKIAANCILKLINAIPSIDPYSDSGLKPAHCKGVVELQAVAFRYPSRANHSVLEDISITVNAGQTLALVGPSGSGKSTLIRLIERFYDLDRGRLLIDGVNIKDLNLAWLRQQIGLVSQEPVLFAQTIEENIRSGNLSHKPTEEEIEEVARKANILDFIKNLPKNYDTFVGEGGEQLSGGQKQRIAIARVLLRNPKILLLDEATSSLDTGSEKLVQEALDVAKEGRTSIVIAHRLSTIKNADQIAVIENGRIVEVGTHESLLDKQGAYHRLFYSQATILDNDLNRK